MYINQFLKFIGENWKIRPLVWQYAIVSALYRDGMMVYIQVAFYTDA